ncbi:MAG: arsenic resistance N-acetyltransferase ArsN2 [Pseudomonadota bacterium]
MPLAVQISPLSEIPSALREVTALLSEAGLPIDDIDRDEVVLSIATADGAVVAAIGTEIYGSVGLLRSLVVSHAMRRRGLGIRMVAHLEDFARKAGAAQLFLLTETETGFFSRLGYAAIPREQVPDAIRATRQFSSLCPDSADCMHKLLDAS